MLGMKMLPARQCDLLMPTGRGTQAVTTVDLTYPTFRRGMMLEVFRHLGALRRTTHHRLDTRQQFPGTKGFDHVVVRAAAQPADHIFFLPLGGQDDHRKPRPDLAQL